LSEGTRNSHILHFLVVGEEECLRRLLVRNDRKPEGLYFASTTEAVFRAICKWFSGPNCRRRPKYHYPWLIDSACKASRDVIWWVLVWHARN
jgi:hypothetical protein